MGNAPPPPLREKGGGSARVDPNLEVKHPTSCTSLPVVPPSTRHLAGRTRRARTRNRARGSREGWWRGRKEPCPPPSKDNIHTSCLKHIVPKATFRPGTMLQTRSGLRTHQNTIAQHLQGEVATTCRTTSALGEVRGESGEASSPSPPPGGVG